MRAIRRRFGLIALLIVVAAIGVFVYRSRMAGDKKPEIRTDVVKRGTVAASVSGNGVLQPITTVEVKSNVGGTIMDLKVDEGDYVTAGQVIATIDPSDANVALQQAESDLTGAQARVDQSKQGQSMQVEQTTAGILAAQKSLEVSQQRLAQAGQQAEIQPKLTSESIKQAESELATAKSALTQAKAALVPQKLAGAKAAFDQAKANLDQADRQLVRQRALLDKGFVAKSQVDQAEQDYEVSKAQMDNARSKLDTVQDEADQDLRTAEARVAQATSALETARVNSVQVSLKQQDLKAAQAAVEQAKAALASANATKWQNQMKDEDIKQARAQMQRAVAAVQNARTQLGYTTVLAPRAGVVVKKYVDTGSIVTAGRSAFGGGSGSGITIVDIADVSRMWVVVNVDETDIARISLGQEVDVTVDAYPDQLFGGKVIKVAPEAFVDQNVTTIPVTVEIAQSDRRLKPSMNATCDFVTARKRFVLYVPNEAVTDSGNQTTVTVLENGKQVKRTVQVGLIGNDNTEILSGLKQGETVVTAEIQANPTGTQGGPGGGRGGPRMF